MTLYENTRNKYDDYDGARVVQEFVEREIEAGYGRGFVPDMEVKLDRIYEVIGLLADHHGIDLLELLDLNIPNVRFRFKEKR